MNIPCKNKLQTERNTEEMRWKRMREWYVLKNKWISQRTFNKKQKKQKEERSPKKIDYCNTENIDKYQIDDRGRYVRWSTEIQSTAALYSTFLSFPFLLIFPFLSYHLLLCSTTPSSALSSHFTLLSALLLLSLLYSPLLISSYLWKWNSKCLQNPSL